MKKHKRKLMYLALLALLLFSLTGCSGREKEKGPDNGVEDESGKDKAENKPDQKEEITAEDFQPGNGFIMKTEKGYYYHRSERTEDGTVSGAFRYVDSATGKDIYLCNKPECKHDGNIFCVATNAKYMIGQTCLYSGRIFATALEETDTQYLYKLLSIALDGSEMSEIATYMTIAKMSAESAGQVPAIFAGKLPVHRNKAVISLSAWGKLDDTFHYGTAILDLNTGKVSYLDEEPLSKENSRAEGVKAYGDYIYYSRKEGRKNVLHRYCVKDGTDESYKLQPGFQGTYAVLDEDNIIYMRSAGNVLYLYHPSTEETEEAKTLTAEYTFVVDETEVTLNYNIGIKEIMTDGTYLYIPWGGETIFHGETEEKVRRVSVLDRNFEEVAMVDMIKVLPEGLEDIYTYSNEAYWSFLGDEIYAILQRDPDPVIYKCRRSDFLEGNPRFEFLYEE